MPALNLKSVYITSHARSRLMQRFNVAEFPCDAQPMFVDYVSTPGKPKQLLYKIGNIWAIVNCLNTHIITVVLEKWIKYSYPKAWNTYLNKRKTDHPGTFPSAERSSKSWEKWFKRNTKKETRMLVYHRTMGKTAKRNYIKQQLRLFGQVEVELN